MNVTIASLESLILKATKETLSCPDEMAVEAFAAVMRCSPDGPQLAAQELAARIHNPQPHKALLTLSMTDQCMRKCGAEFHSEIGKFRFLNEMIKLVSPKYLADRTAPEVRTRILQLLHAWSIEYPQEFKFKVAFDMLRNQGVVKETPPPLPPEGEPAIVRTKHAIFEDEEKSRLLQKLLQSKKPEDLQHANRLIKTMVREEERRTEACCRRRQEINTAMDSAHLLRDMLTHADAADATGDEVSLIHELHSIVDKMRVVLDEIGPAMMAEGETISGVLDASIFLDEVHETYEAFCGGRKKKKAETAAPLPKNDSLLDFAGATANVDEAGSAGPKITAKKNSIDELGDIFATETGNVDHDLLQPVNVMTNDDVDLLGDKNKTEGWNELDSLGEQLLKQSLPENAKRVDSFNGKTKKVPMNALTTPKHESTPVPGPVFDLDFFTKLETEPNKKPGTIDDVMVDITHPQHKNTNILDIELSSTDANKSKTEVKPLMDINVTLDSVQPSNVQPLTAFEERDGLTVVLHFCKDKPRPDVNVVVISTTSRSGSPIEDYKLQCVVPKGCKVRLLPASGTSLPVFNPFLPPPALTQVMLVARPHRAQVSLKFVLTYCADQDVCSEMGEVKVLPLDDIQ